MNKKKLYRNMKDKKIDGVCSGLAEYLEMDVVVIRFIAMCGLLFWGTTGLIYFIAIIVIPKNPNEFL
ncbi:MAG: PspC domain-containing protein [Mycoplasmatales bacterium]